MEEATEKLVRIYLESKGFFVRTNERIKVDKNRYPEIDIIAIRLKPQKDNLPNKIVGEVKSWSLKLIHFPDTNCLKKDLRHKGKFKAFFEDRKKAEEEIEKRYGKGFKFIIFCRKVARKNQREIENKLKNLKTEIIYLENVADEIVDHSKKQGYSNDPELQILRLLKKKF